MSVISITLDGELNSRTAAAHHPSKLPSQGVPFRFDEKGVGKAALSPGEWVLTWIVTAPEETHYKVTVEGGAEGKIGPQGFVTFSGVGPGNVLITVAK